MCAINAYSSVLVPCSPLAINWSSWSTATHRLSPRACALLGQLAELAAASELAQLAGRCGAGVCACACGCLRACGLRVRLACVRVRAAWSSWCARACLRASGVHACGCGVGVRAAARVRSRWSSRQLHFLRRAFGSGRVSDVEVREFVGVRKSRFTKSTSSKSSKGSKVKVVKF